VHYFKRNIGDYHKKAGRLSMLEHGAYTLLLDACYDRERFPTIDEALEWSWARTDDEVLAVKFVLSKFFTLDDSVYFQQRVKDEIDAYRAKSVKNQEIALAREAARRSSRERIEHETCTEDHLTINQEPLTKNQEPIESKALVTDESATQEGKPARKVDPVPYELIIESYRKCLPSLPQPQAMTPKRKAGARGIWSNYKKSHDPDFWDRYFTYVGKQEFLCNMRGIGINWLLNFENMCKVIEGNYE